MTPGGDAAVLGSEGILILAEKDTLQAQASFSVEHLGFSTFHRRVPHTGRPDRFCHIGFLLSALVTAHRLRGSSRGSKMDGQAGAPVSMYFWAET